MNNLPPSTGHASGVALAERRLTAAEFQGLAKVPAAAKWFANLDNPRTRRAYQGDIEDFCSFLGIHAPDQFCAVTRAHVLAWRGQLEQRCLSGATIRRKLAALASLFDYLLDANAVAGGNPVHGVKRPKIETNEGKTPALSDHQAKTLLEAPDPATLLGLRDRAVLAVLLYHSLRREEAARLTIQDMQERRGIKHRVSTVRAASCDTCHCTPSSWSASMLTWKTLGITRSTLRHRYLCHCVARPLAQVSASMASMPWLGVTPLPLALRSQGWACMGSVQRPPPTRWSMRWILPRSSNDCVTPTSVRRKFTTGADCDRWTRRPSRFGIAVGPQGDR